LDDVQEIEYQSHPESKYRYYLVGIATIDDKKVKIVCTHLTHAVRNMVAPLQMKQLIDDFDSDPYVVILADWNSSPSEFQPLKDAGYVFANNDAFGSIMTYYSTEYYEGAMDNIAVKGGRIVKAGVIDTNDDGVGMLSDHYVLFCDVRFDKQINVIY